VKQFARYITNTYTGLLESGAPNIRNRLIHPTLMTMRLNTPNSRIASQEFQCGMAFPDLNFQMGTLETALC
jgi:hypothetical protein